VPPAHDPSVPARAYADGVRSCSLADPQRIGEWRYALIGGPFEPRLAMTSDELRRAWAAGDVAAAPETAIVLRGVLGAGAPPAFTAADHPALARGRFAVVAVDELAPSYSIVTVDGAHPLAREATGPLAIGLCASAPRAPIRNLDPARLTTLVMSGTTALTGRTAERLDHYGIADTIKYLAPFFTTADLVHISNEVTFVRDCHPARGQKPPLSFCSRDRYIDVLAALHASIIELTGSHLFDYGQSSLVRTLDMYERRGWVWYGGGRTQIDATAPRIVEDHGNRLAFVGCNHVNWWIKAIFAGPGGANCDYPRMVWQIGDLRRRGYTVIATVQHRELRTHRPDGDLVDDLRRLAEAGATFVEGSQAHTAHPWDVHDRAYVHYGPGNTLFAQYIEAQREATVDKLYIHAGTLLAVDHLFIRTEHGQPRLLTDRERTRFLDQMITAEAAIAPPDPWRAPPLPPETRVRPDSVVSHGRSQALTVTVPERVADGRRYPLVVTRRSSCDQPDAFVVVPTGRAVASLDEIATFMAAKYPIDPARVALRP